mmetsp:Transcript_7087/g.7260  ORF Transcript_7087/g.7260 Transcript_7087/m.7260 type:complete len:256 (-) Transcript_7087:34-801(-)
MGCEPYVKGCVKIGHVPAHPRHGGIQPRLTSPLLANRHRLRFFVHQCEAAGIPQQPAKDQTGIPRPRSKINNVQIPIAATIAACGGGGGHQIMTLNQIYKKNKQRLELHALPTNPNPLIVPNATPTHRIGRERRWNTPPINTPQHRPLLFSTQPFKKTAGCGRFVGRFVGVISRSLDTVFDLGRQAGESLSEPMGAFVLDATTPLLAVCFDDNPASLQRLRLHSFLLHINHPHRHAQFIQTTSGRYVRYIVSVGG